MRKYLLAMAVAAAGLIIPASAYAQGGRCEELRLACEKKEQLGEQGRGNCRAYREQCSRRVSCGQLRHYCLHKEEYGAQGQGFCRRYRENCT